MKFQKALHFTLSHEGGTNYHVNDRGGLTSWGISEKQYPDLNISDIGMREAVEIYEKDYWNPGKCEHMEESLAITVFDSSVNCGLRSAGIWLQKSLNHLGATVEVDGIVGVITIHAANLHNPYDLSGKVISHRLNRYTKLISRDPEQRVFVLGWMNRVSDLLRYI